MVLLVFRDEAADRTVVGPFTLRRENTARQLLHLPVVGDALAAVTFPLARLVSAGASGFIPIDMAFSHLKPPYRVVGRSSSPYPPYLIFSSTAAARRGNMIS